MSEGSTNSHGAVNEGETLSSNDYTSVERNDDVENNHGVERQGRTVEQIEAENKKLKAELENLRENVVIESMNQMKQDYARICRNAACGCETAKLMKAIRDLKRSIFAIDTTSYSLYEMFGNVMKTVRTSKTEINKENWISLRKELKHIDHILLHLTDLCDDCNLVQDPKFDKKNCICTRLIIENIFEDDDLLQLVFSPENGTNAEMS